MKCADRSNGRRASSPIRLGSTDVYTNLDPVLKGRDMDSASQTLQGCKAFKSTKLNLQPATSVHTRRVFSTLLPGFWSSKSTELELCTSMATQLMLCMCEAAMNGRGNTLTSTHSVSASGKQEVER